MAGKFELKKAKNGDFHFNLLDSAQQIILTSEMYKTKASAENGIASIMKNAAEDARYNRLEASNGKPYFVLKAANHQVIGQSKLYTCEADREIAITLVKQHAPDAMVDDLTA